MDTARRHSLNNLKFSRTALLTAGYPVEADLEPPIESFEFQPGQTNTHPALVEGLRCLVVRRCGWMSCRMSVRGPGSMGIAVHGDRCRCLSNHGVYCSQIMAS